MIWTKNEQGYKAQIDQGIITFESKINFDKPVKVYHLDFFLPGEEVPTFCFTDYNDCGEGEPVIFPTTPPTQDYYLPTLDVLEVLRRSNHEGLTSLLVSELEKIAQGAVASLKGLGYE